MNLRFVHETQRDFIIHLENNVIKDKTLCGVTIKRWMKMSPSSVTKSKKEVTCNVCKSVIERGNIKKLSIII